MRQMAPVQGLRQTQTQQTIVTQELRQALAILQMSIQELLAFVQQQTQNNPLLDMEGTDFETEIHEIEPDWLDYFDDRSDLGMVFDRPQILSPSASVSDQSRSLTELLSAEWNLLARTTIDKEIGLFIIDCLDQDGYLPYTASEVAEILKQPRSRVTRILKAIQDVENNGVGARNLKECLLIQIKAKGADYPEVRRVIVHHLEDLAEGRVKEIARALRSPLQEVQRVCDFVRSLDPKPGQHYGGREPVHYVTPDVTVEDVAGEYVVMVNDAVESRLKINDSYRCILTDNESIDGTTREYLELKLESALWIIRSIEQRRQTIYRIVQTLLTLQKSFFDCGLRHIKPLTMQKVAGEIVVHESTISRALTNKFIQTKHGVFPLRLLFGGGVMAAEGTGLAAESVKRAIVEIIGQEDERQPFSDPELSDLLAERGIKVARRTVAKYRQEVNIPPRSRRRRYG